MLVSSMQYIKQNHDALIENVNLFMFLLDIDECEIGSHSCLENSTCVNAAGSFRCFCNKGFTGDGSKACYGIYVAKKLVEYLIKYVMSWPTEMYWNV